MRKIVQFQDIPDTRYQSGCLTVLCDDGSMWFLLKGSWTRLPDIPQDEVNHESNQ